MTLFLQLLVYGAALGSVYGLVGVGFTLIYGATKHFHIAIAATFELAAYLTYALTVNAGLPLWAGATVGIVAGTLFGPLIAVVLYRPIEARGLSSFSLFVASLGALTIVDNVLVNWLGPGTLQAPSPASWSAGLMVGDVSISPLHIASLVAGLIFVAVYVQVSARTRWGWLVRGISDNRELLGLLGQRSKLIEVGVYAFGSLPVAVAGVYVGLVSGASPGVGTGFVLVAFLAVFLGTIGNIGGAFVAAISFGIIQSVLQTAVPSAWSLAITFAVFLGAIAVLSGGLNRVAVRTS